MEDGRERLRIVILQVQVDAEAGTQRCREQAAARGGADKGEGVEVNLYGACCRSAVDEDVYLIVLHGRVEIFLHDGCQAVYLVDEEHVVRLEAREEACQVARLVEDGPRGHLEPYAELVGDDVRQRRLAQSRRSVEQCVVQRFAAVFGRLDKDAQVVHHLLLSAEVLEGQRSQGVFKVAVRLGRRLLRGTYVESVVCHSCRQS